MSKTIYKKDSKGKIRFIKYSTLGSTLLQESGLLDGKSTTAARVCKAKNIGKSNETTPAEQALKEMDSKIKDKLTGEYFETIEEAQNTEVIGPMLAKDYFKRTQTIDFNSKIFIQPKLDGMRCLAIIKNGQVTLQSRDYKEILTMNHIKTQLESLNLKDCILDGELYNSNLGPFQEQMKACKKVSAKTLKINFNIYDIVLDMSFNHRHRILKSILKDVPSPGNNIRLVHTEEIDPLIIVSKRRKILDKRFGDFYLQCMSRGYEGIMIRIDNKSYGMNKRCDSLLKYKKFHDMACIIEDIVPNEAHPEQGTVLCSIINDYGVKTIFKCGMKMSHEDRKKILINKDKYIGKIAELRYFEMTTSEYPVPRFPICHGFRLDKTTPDSINTSKTLTVNE